MLQLLQMIERTPQFLDHLDQRAISPVGLFEGEGLCSPTSHYTGTEGLHPRGSQGIPVNMPGKVMDNIGQRAEMCLTSN
jgi:hypothetical protein